MQHIGTNFDPKRN